jgi:hypothetical protein
MHGAFEKIYSFYLALNATYSARLHILTIISLEAVSCKKGYLFRKEK